MTTLVWIQREFRLNYLPALQQALDDSERVIVAYFHDEKSVIGEANSVWLAQSLQTLQAQYQSQDGDFWIVAGDFKTELDALIRKYEVSKIHYTYQVGLSFRQQQQSALSVCQKHEIVLTPFFSEDLLLPEEILNQQNKPYLVFTPFYKRLMAQQALIAPLEHTRQNLAKTSIIPVPKIFQRLPCDLRSLVSESWAVSLMSNQQVGEIHAWTQLENFIDSDLHDYALNRDFPALSATSRLSPYIHFGQIPINALYFRLLSEMELGASSTAAAQVWIRQLIWHVFARYLLYWFPETEQQPFQKKYQFMEWSDDEGRLKAWQAGKTGIPMIDAGMRELWQTGIMHNRVRMLVASFLTKNLNQHWLHGKAWFEETLLDADPANNTMGWQWVAGCGVDASPYYRLFNPVVQSKKFDTQGEYIKYWLPELKTLSAKAIHEPWLYAEECRLNNITLGEDYPLPIVDLKLSREEHLQRVNTLKSIILE